jgi:hypothetical protein
MELVLGKKLLEASEALADQPPYTVRTVELTRGELRLLINALALVEAVREVTR